MQRSCQGVEGAYECTLPTGNVEACKSCLDGCYRNAKTIEEFNTCDNGCKNGPDYQGMERTYQVIV